jgi:hypothetical protein
VLHQAYAAPHAEVEVAEAEPVEMVEMVEVQIPPTTPTWSLTITIIITKAHNWIRVLINITRNRRTVGGGVKHAFSDLQVTGRSCDPNPEMPEPRFPDVSQRVLANPR